MSTMENTKNIFQGKSQSPDDVAFDTSQPAPPEYSVEGREKSKMAHGHDKSDMPLDDITLGGPSSRNMQADTPAYGIVPESGPKFPPAIQQQPARQGIVAYEVPFGESSVPIQCPKCNERTASQTKYRSGGYTYSWALGLGFVMGCCCIPFCVDKMKNVEHRCRHCGSLIATWHRYDKRVETHWY